MITIQTPQSQMTILSNAATFRKGTMRCLPILLSVIMFASCDKTIDDLASPPFHHFDVMGLRLEEKISPFTVGMSYAVYQNGVLKVNGSKGNRQLGTVGPALPYNSDTRQTIFSITKTLTAAATMAFLNKNNVPLTTSIKPYFPHTWNLTNLPDNITFEDLLRHRSGLVGTLDSYDDMKTYIEAGSFAPRGSFVYANINFTLLRILVPMTDPGINFGTTLAPMTDYNIGVSLSYEFVDIMRDEVTNKAGLSSNVGPLVWDMADPSTSTMLYNFQNQNQAGVFILNSWPELNDFTQLCGAGGWYLNTIEYASIIDKLFKKNLNTRIDVDKMRNDRLGLYGGNNSAPGVKGFFTHGGNAGNSRGGHSRWVYLVDYGITVVVFANSNNSGEPYNDNALVAIIEAISESYY